MDPLPSAIAADSRREDHSCWHLPRPVPAAGRGRALALWPIDGGPTQLAQLPTGRRPASLPAAAAEHPEARVLVMSGRTGGWKGVFSVH